MNTDARNLWSFAKDLYWEQSNDRVSLTAAGIAFFGLLSLFPGIAAVMALGGLLTQPAVLVRQMQDIGSVLPPEASKIIIDQAVQIAGTQNGGLGLTAIVGILLSVYSASQAVGSLVTGIHVAAGRPETRGFIASAAFTLAMTVVGIGLALLAILSTVVVPALLASVHASDAVAWGLGLARWPIMGLITASGLGLFYRLSIEHRRPPPRWITPGAIMGATMWLVGSVGFSLYVQNFADYNKTFGTLGGVISLLMWLWLSAFIVLLGEEVNALLEARERASSRQPQNADTPTEDSVKR